MDISWLIAIDGSPPSLKVVDDVLSKTINPIVKLANDIACRLIVMGAHGFGRVIGLLIGSVTTKVVQPSPWPVLVVKSCPR